MGNMSDLKDLDDEVGMVYLIYLRYITLPIVEKNQPRNSSEEVCNLLTRVLPYCERYTTM